MYMTDSIGTRKKIKCGVPQGSLLGPTLFLMCMNSIYKLDICGRIKLFPYDITIVYFSESIDDIKSKIDGDHQIIGPLAEPKLSVNIVHVCLKIPIMKMFQKFNLTSIR